jgi:hypothetical protein
MGFTGGEGPAGPQGPPGPPGATGAAGPAGSQDIVAWAFVHDVHGGAPALDVGRGFTDVTRAAATPSIYCLSPDPDTRAVMERSTPNAPSYAVLVSPMASGDTAVDPAMKALRYTAPGNSGPCSGHDDIAIQTFSGNDPSTGIDFTLAVLALS